MGDLQVAQGIRKTGNAAVAARDELTKRPHPPTFSRKARKRWLSWVLDSPKLSWTPVYQPFPFGPAGPTSGFFDPCFLTHKASRDSCCTCTIISVEEREGCGERLPPLVSPAQLLPGAGDQTSRPTWPTGSHRPCLPPSGSVSPLPLLMIKGWVFYPWKST